jgi:hypothetical protein
MRKFRAMMSQPSLGHEGIWVWSSNLNNWSSHNGSYYGDIKNDTITQYVRNVSGEECYVGDILQLPNGKTEIVNFNQEKSCFDPFQEEEWRNSSCIIGNIFTKK